jgi:hypothetical protein
MSNGYSGVTPAVDRAENVIATGGFRGTLNLGRGTISASGTNDTLLAKFAP